MADTITPLTPKVIDGVLHNYLVFDDIDTSTEGYLIQTAPSYEYPETINEEITIPGRNGILFHFTGAYNNTIRTYNLIKKIGERGSDNYLDHSTFVNEAKQIVAKFKSKQGYYKLQDTFEPNYYRYACITNEGTVTNLLDEVMSITLEFSCKPQRYLISGDSPITPVNDKINNPEKFPSKPLITVTKGNGNTSTLTIEKKDFKINWDGVHNTVIIDSEMMDCYDSDKHNLNSLLDYISDFPEFIPGDNEITIDDGSFEIIPRWWTL